MGKGILEKHFGKPKGYTTEAFPSRHDLEWFLVGLTALLNGPTRLGLGHSILDILYGSKSLGPESIPGGCSQKGTSLLGLKSHTIPDGKLTK